MDDFLILLQAKLDEAKSKGNVNADIEKIQSQLDKLKIQVTIDPKSISNITSQMSKLGIQVGQDFGKAFNNGLSSTINADDMIKSSENVVRHLNEQKDVTDKVILEEEKLANQMADVREKSEQARQSEEKRQQLAQNNAINKALEQEYQERLKLVEATKDQANKIQLSLDTGETESKIDALIAKTNQWTDANGNARISTQSLVSAFDNLGIAANEYLKTPTEENQRKLIEANEKLSVEYKKVTSDIRSMNAELAKSSAIDNLRLQYQNFYSENGKAHKLFGIQLRSAMTELAHGAEVPKQRLEELKRELIDTKTVCKGLGLTGQTWFQNLGDKIKQLSTYLSGTVIIGKSLKTAKQMYNAVYDIDTAMTNLYKVTDETERKYTQFLDSASVSAKKLGRSISSLVEQTANWAKLGYDIDTAARLAEISSIYANVGEVDDNTAVSDIVTVMKAYDIAADDAIQIVNKYNKLGNEFATSARDLGEGLSNSASMLAMGGTDINKALALLTGGAEITQSAGELGNALKVGQMRIQGMKGALEELGEEIDENVESISKMQTHILNLTSGKVNIFDDNENFKDYYDILEEISKIIDDLSSTDRADLLETIFGKNRANQGSAILQAFQSGQVQKALEATLNAENSAMEEQEKWLNSLEAKIQQYEAAFQSLSNTVLDSDLLKEIVDFGTDGVSSFEGFIKVLEHANSLLGLTTKNMGGLLGVVSGLIMNKNGIGECTVFQW